MRADALRNRDALLTAANTLFALKGAAVEMDEIAAAADVAVGTVYRHLGPKDAIIEVLIAKALDELHEESRQLFERREPADAFRALLATLVDTTCSRKHLVALFDDAWSPAATDARTALRDRYRATLEEALARVQGVGAVRTDIGVSEVIALVHGAFPYLARTDELGDDAARRRLFGLMQRALAPESSPTPPARQRPVRTAPPAPPLPAPHPRQLPFAFDGSSSHASPRAPMPPLARDQAYAGTTWIPRILWALEWASRSGIGPQTPAAMARILKEHAGVDVLPNNVARAFRDLGGKKDVAKNWKKVGTSYEIQRRGSVLLQSILDGTTAPAHADPSNPPEPASAKKEGSAHRRRSPSVQAIAISP